jgi:hypothetical protein
MTFIPSSEYIRERDAGFKQVQNLGANPQKNVVSADYILQQLGMGALLNEQSDDQKATQVSTEKKAKPKITSSKLSSELEKQYVALVRANFIEKYSRYSSGESYFGTEKLDASKLDEFLEKNPLFKNCWVEASKEWTDALSKPT